MGLLDLYISNTLRLSRPEELDRHTKARDKHDGVKNSPKSRSSSLDIDGPRLIEGYRRWLQFYQVTGLINLSNKPLYACIAYKMVVFLIALTLMGKVFEDGHRIGVIKQTSFKNPIFIFTVTVALFAGFSQAILVSRICTFQLKSFFDLLNTPKLCFLNRETLKQLGDGNLVPALIHHGVQTFFVFLATSRNFESAFTVTNLFLFGPMLFTVIFTFYQMNGLTSAELYIRSAFGFWLLELKKHLEIGFARAHTNRVVLHVSSDDQHGVDKRSDEDESDDPMFTEVPRSFDWIQSKLNNMDDYLEALRTINDKTLTNVSLMAFLTNGCLSLVIYILAVDGNMYHFTVLAIFAIDYNYTVFKSYFGDRWLYYALSSFVQTVEDEYFMQLDYDQPTTMRSLHQSGTVGLIIRRQDVLFCHEFLHQFENHLATPWTKLTFKSHLHLLRTFVTLTAAQIIFEH